MSEIKNMFRNMTNDEVASFYGFQGIQGAIDHMKQWNHDFSPSVMRGLLDPASDNLPEKFTALTGLSFTSFEQLKERYNIYVDENSVSVGAPQNDGGMA